MFEGYYISSLQEVRVHTRGRINEQLGEQLCSVYERIMAISVLSNNTIFGNH